MHRAILLALLALSGCAEPYLPEETGAPPRPWPPGMQLDIRTRPDAALQETSGARINRIEVGESYHLYAFTERYPHPTQNKCVIFITDRPLTPEQRNHILTHEKRHCAGQQHIWKDGKLVWLP